MAAFTKFQSFVEALAEKTHNLGADTLKVALSNSAPTASTDTQFSDISEITAGNGYSAGGSTVPITSSAQSGGTYKLVGTDVTITASGGTIGPFRYVVLYNDTAANNELIGYWDYGASISITDTNSFVVDFDGTNGILQIA